MTVVVLCCALAACSFLVAASGLPCESPEQPHLVLTTVEGSVEIELFPAAAPEAVARLVRLAVGPVFDSTLVNTDLRHGIVGYYDGLWFDLAYPHTSLATSVRPPADTFLIRTQIDAGALGLDARLILTAPEATNVWQFELFPHSAGLAADADLHPRLQEWLGRWNETFSAGFLVGVSQREINEALGYSYVSGLESQPVTRGSVALEPFDTTWSTPRLVIALRDFPKFDGRRMVVGRVVSGLDLVDDISARKLSPDRAVRNRPLVPVKISGARVDCRRPGKPDDATNGVK